MDNPGIRPEWIPSAYSDLNKHKRSGTTKTDETIPELNTRLFKYSNPNKKRGKRLRLQGI